MDIFSIMMYILIFIFFPIFLGIMNIYEQKKCTQKINGTYIGYAEQCVKGFKKYYPKFVYEFNNKIYESTTNQGFEYCDICEFNMEEKYSIFVNEKNPYYFIIKKNNSVGAYISIAIGIIFIIILCLEI